MFLDAFTLPRQRTTAGTDGLRLRVDIIVAHDPDPYRPPELHTLNIVVPPRRLKNFGGKVMRLDIVGRLRAKLLHDLSCCCYFPVVIAPSL